MTSEYSEKLRDPRWQKKRLEILERDDWTCQKCFDSESTLVVHHRKYLPATDPWDYPDILLVTLCEDCHESERARRPEAEEILLDALRSSFFSEEIITLANGFYALKKLHIDGVVAEAYKRALVSPDIQQELIDGFLKDLKEEEGLGCNDPVTEM